MGEKGCVIACRAPKKCCTKSKICLHCKCDVGLKTTRKHQFSSVTEEMHPLRATAKVCERIQNACALCIVSQKQNWIVLTEVFLERALSST